MNSSNYRELEYKFRIKPKKGELAKFLLNLRQVISENDRYLYANTIDNYWQVPGKGDFLRLRHSWGHDGDFNKKSLKEITVKQKDKGNNVDRLEMNGKISDIKLFRKILTVSLGQPKASLRKKEYVFFADCGTVISVCKLKKDWYLEIEGKRMIDLKKWHYICKHLASFQFINEKRSLYEIYVAEPTNEP